jgi:hypothetical protein
MNGMSPEQIADLIEHRKWVPIAGIVIWFLTRLFKDDTKSWLPSVPGRWRPFVPFALAILSAVGEALFLGKPWLSAFIGGVLSAVEAITIQDLLINALRGGKEIPVPGLMVEGARPAPDKPVTVPPDPDRTQTAPKFTPPANDVSPQVDPGDPSKSPEDGRLGG